MSKDVSEKSSDLSVSDWITFLSNEKSLSFNLALGMATILIAWVAIMITIFRADIWWLILLWVAGIIGMYLYMYFKIFRKSKANENEIQKILRLIMKGDLRSPEEIKNLWEAKVKY